MSGSELNLVDGLISDAGRIAVAVAEEQDLFDLSTLKEPYRAEGKKTMGLEIAMQLGWKMPDAIVYPTGGGHRHHWHVQGLPGIARTRLDRRQSPQVHRRPGLRLPAHRQGFSTKARTPPSLGPTLPPSPTDSGSPAPLPTTSSSRPSARPGAPPSPSRTTKWSTPCTSLPPPRASSPAPKALPPSSASSACSSRVSYSPDETIVLLNTGSGYKYLDLIKDTA